MRITLPAARAAKRLSAAGAFMEGTAMFFAKPRLAMSASFALFALGLLLPVGALATPT